MDIMPGWVFKGKTYKTLTGLMTALQKDTNGSSCCFPSPNVARVDIREAGGAWKPVAHYDLTPPKFGEKQVVTKRI